MAAAKEKSFTGFKPSDIPKRKNILSSGDYSSANPHPDYIKRGPLITKEIFDKWTPDLLGIPDINCIDLSKPPPQIKMWSASPDDLQFINNSIRGV